MMRPTARLENAATEFRRAWRRWCDTGREHHNSAFARVERARFDLEAAALAFRKPVGERR